jgi:hypothetical protein
MNPIIPLSSAERPPQRIKVLDRIYCFSFDLMMSVCHKMFLYHAVLIAQPRDRLLDVTLQRPSQKKHNLFSDA